MNFQKQEKEENKEEKNKMNKEVILKDVIEEDVVGTVGSISLLSTVQRPLVLVVGYLSRDKGFSFYQGDLL